MRAHSCLIIIVGRGAGLAVARAGAGTGALAAVAFVVVDPEFGELLVQGVPVDAEAGGGLDVDALAGLEHLLDQLALDLADDPVMQVVGGGAGGADALADQLGGQGPEVGPAGADGSGGGLAPQLRRQVRDGQIGAVAQDDRPLDVVLELADVPRPVVVAEQAHRIGVDPPHLAPVLLGVAPQEEIDQERDVLTPLAQGGQVDRDDVEAIVQVLAEPAGVDLVEQVAVGRGDDPGIDLDGTDVADALELALLQDAEQLDLELGGGAVDLDEEDAAGEGGLEPAGPVIDGAGERALDVAEQLAFEQALGQGAAVDADVRAGVARAEVVDGARDEFFARAGLADDQDAGARGGDLVSRPEDLGHGRAGADDARQGGVVPSAGRIPIVGDGHRRASFPGPRRPHRAPRPPSPSPSVWGLVPGSQVRCGRDTDGEQVMIWLRLLLRLRLEERRAWAPS